MGQNTAPLLTQIFSSSPSSFSSNGCKPIADSPHILISGTTFAQSLFCARKALFSDRFRISGSNLAMTVGKIAHELFQIALVQRPSNLSRKWLFRLWRLRFFPAICFELVAMQCSLERFEEELSPYLDNIATWIRTHVSGHHPKPIAYLKRFPLLCKGGEDGTEENDDEAKNATDREPIYFNSIRDIEENVWTPTLGMKGRIDVSLLASSSPPHRSNDQEGAANATVSSNNERRPQAMVIPLELKTGKSYGNGVGNIEHHSQVLIYSMMLAERANNDRVVPGFLLYLFCRDNAIVEVRPRVAELRSLLHRRNQLAVKHFSRFTLDSLPVPLNDPHSCRLCPFNALCGALAKVRIAADEAKSNGAEDGQIGNSAPDGEEIIWVGSGKSTNGRGTAKRRRHTYEKGFEEGDDKENVPPPQHQTHGEGEIGIEEEILSPEMHAFLSKSTAHLSDAEISYARRCIRRTLSQWEESGRRSSVKTLFSESPEERGRLGLCFYNMELMSTTKTASSGSSSDDLTSNNSSPTNAFDDSAPSFLLWFKKTCDANGVYYYGARGEVKTKLEPGNIVTVSTDNAYALLIATIVSINSYEHSLKVLSDKCIPNDLGQLHGQQTMVLYHLDKHDGFGPFAFRLGAVAALLENNNRAQRLRSILTTGRAAQPQMVADSLVRTTPSPTVGTNEQGMELPEQMIDVELVTEDESCQTDGAACEAMSLLDETLKEPIRCVLNTPEFSIVMGRNKKEISGFISAFCRTLLRRNKSVLFCANSNAAVDELLQCFVSEHSIPDANLLRIGRRHAVRPALQHLLLDTKMAQLAGDRAKLNADEEAKTFYCRVKQLSQQKPLFVACTLASVASSGFLTSSNPFDFFLIGEASELADTELMQALQLADRFVLCTAQKKPAKHSLLNRLIPMVTTQRVDSTSPRRLITLGGPPPTRHPLWQIFCPDSDTKLSIHNTKKEKGPSAETPMGMKAKQQQTAKRRRTMTLFDFWKK